MSHRRCHHGVQLRLVMRLQLGVRVGEVREVRSCLSMSLRLGLCGCLGDGVVVSVRLGKGLRLGLRLGLNLSVGVGVEL